MRHARLKKGARCHADNHRSIVRNNSRMTPSVAIEIKASAGLKYVSADGLKLLEVLRLQYKYYYKCFLYSQVILVSRSQALLVL